MWTILYWIFLLVLPIQMNCSTQDERCLDIKTVSYPACDLFKLSYEPHLTLPCTSTGDVVTEHECVQRRCCWFKDKCHKEPVKCYLDFRSERCLARRSTISASNIFEGYSANGSYCYIDEIQSYLESHERAFNGSTSVYGVRTLSQDKRHESCVVYVKTNVTKLPDGKCNIKLENKPTWHGNVWANKCVLQTKKRYFKFDFGIGGSSCTCNLDAWTVSASEKLNVSDAIREYVKNEGSKNSCTQILGRLVRKSWKNRLEIVNNVEANVVVNALLNVTNEKASKITTKDAKVILDTSEELSKYKYYDGLENRSANDLIQSSVKIMSKLMESVTSRDTQEMSKPDSPDGLSLYPGKMSSYEAPDNLQWKIMHNLENIAENAASLIKLDKSVEKYVVEAKAEAVSLQVALARNNDVILLTNANTTQEKNKNFTKSKQRAQVNDFSSYDKGDGDENIAVITAFYNVPPENMTASKNRASNILAINLRTVKDGVVREKLSLPVIFTLERSNTSCNGSECKDVCVYAEENSTSYEESWNGYGCSVYESGANFTTCVCNHTTHFAVLMHSGKSPFTEFDTKILELLSVCLGSISIACLCATMIVFIKYKRILLKDRMVIHLHLIIALMCGYVSFLAGSLFSKHHLDISGPCFASAVLSHLFFLSSFFWCLMEGIYLFYKVVMVFSNQWAEWGTKYSPILGWIIPIIIVAASLIVSRVTESLNIYEGYDNYYSIHTCFLQKANGMIWAFMGPTLGIIAINVFILLKVVVVIFRSSLTSSSKSKASNPEKYSHSLKNSVKGAVMLMPILGVPWIVNLFVEVGDVTDGEYNYAATAGAYVHVVFMGLQGVEIFLFYCVFNGEVRNAYRLSAERRKSLASIEFSTKNRKRSRAPLLTSKEGSPESQSRYKNSLTITSTGRTMTGTSNLLAASPVSPDRPNSLPMVQENKC